MPSKTLAAPESCRSKSVTPTLSFNNTLVGTCLDPTPTGISMAAGDSKWRPKSARSARSERSASPLFSRLARARHHHHRDRQGAAETTAAGASTTAAFDAAADTATAVGLTPICTATAMAGVSGTAAVVGRASTSSGHHSYNTSTTSSYNGRRASLSSGPPPPLTCEEFEALPLAIQRKYFSTLERLRFAQGSGMVDGIYQHYDAISAQHFKRRRRQDRSASDHFTGRLRRKALRESSSFTTTTTDSYFYASLPEKIKKRQFTREEQVLLAGQLRASVILDAADEAIYKIGRRGGTHLVPLSVDVETPTSPLSPMSPLSLTSMDKDMMQGLRPPPPPPPQPQPQSDVASASKAPSTVPDSFYDSFRWLDEDDDLDLRLFLDDYHANLREVLPSPTQQQLMHSHRRPSFRRHLSISKMPFSRPSLSSSRPPTTDTGSPMSPTSPFPIMPNTSHSNPPGPFSHSRRKSRTLSLITPKHTTHESISSIDPAAAHYQDPETRLKLRVYLASPQKFDEAIEFGFPSSEVHPGSGPNGVGPDYVSPYKRRNTRYSAVENSDTLRTFLADDDDDDKLDSDIASVPDSESPKTPKLADTGVQGAKPPALRPLRLSPEPASGHRPADCYAHVPVSSREMTLRMTLTRPDLRACEDQIYGWQQPQGQQQPQQPHHLLGRKSQTLLREDAAGSSNNTNTTNTMYIVPGSRPKESIDMFAGIDHWGPDAAEKGVVKRFWNRMRRS